MDVYYRIIRMVNNPRMLTVVTMQWFDENSYDEKRFVTAKGKDEPLKFESEEDAVAWLNTNIKHEHIDPEYLNPLPVDAMYKDSIDDMYND